jgi:hypothetical protein
MLRGTNGRTTYTATVGTTTVTAYAYEREASP